MRLALIVLYVPEPALDLAAAFYAAILDTEPVQERHRSGPIHWSISSRLTGLTVEVYPAATRPATATRLTFRGPDVHDAVQRLVDVHALPEPHGSGGWWVTDPAGNTVVLLGSSSYDRLTEPLGLTLGTATAEEATANRRHASELIGRPLPVSEYEAELYRADGRTPPED
ncbi:Glyoxalase-like domain [Mycobacteroides abscessus]|uniref:VOC family protein n=1 Tax=Mycobacteroides abscessus TaxID=36809 RepID=UPI0005DF0B33|nr:glyoxalase/bleomycin resistance/dioxygenase family protein [Mycobacteroides abscessus]CPS10358.1 Glyoxalase-like domain [Mycobacteroides abscessus]CPS50115.1 Glyoxalase-like domain [Mycobacteroides abscessus]CPS93909.1 Glyoxalase-like domain [Mycobacteroides abscessus]CPS94105.1 Glyoxalase-like domain [Mycobacteroides abscessus]CPT62193.1 Glyoxalase-like domain [Mycobacteroides abscessus]